ncbi:MAG: hypothetical protein KF687_01260 [Cyclobacteriaceae bacterium]|nr:hypothetical protein [Cyclobacteriaceae bacterium]
MGWNILRFLYLQDDAPTVGLADPTVYAVETMQRVYHGRIIFQDDIQLKLQTEDRKSVKILKENILRINIVRNEVIEKR